METAGPGRRSARPSAAPRCWKPWRCRDRRYVRGLFAAILIALLAVPPLPVFGGESDSEAGTEVPEYELLQINRRIARFLVEHVKSTQVRKARLNALMDALFSKKGLDIRYGNTHTKTVIETFESRSGNCLSFTLLFVAMARHVGLNAYFKEVAEVTSWDRRGELVVNNQHMYAEVEIDNGVVEVDFLPGAEKRYRQVRRISDQRAKAHFYNNLGVEHLTEERIRESLAYFRKALEVDPTFSPAWINLGVGERRLGNPKTAEGHYRQALRLEPQDPTAKTNLSSLYLATGRAAEAQPLLQQVADYLRQNPFHHFRLGMSSLRGGDSAQAVLHLKEAIRRLATDADFHGALAEAYLQQGQVTAARESFFRAAELSEDRDESERYRKQAERLEPTADEASSR